MKLIGLVLLVLAVLCALLPFCRDALPFRIDLRSADAPTLAIGFGLAGLLAVAAGRA